MSSMLGLNCNVTNPNFKQKGAFFKPPAYSAGQFITDLNKVEEKRLEGNFFSKTIGSPTAYWGSLGIILLGEFTCLAKIFSTKKTDLKNPKLKQSLKNKILLILFSAIAGGITFGAVVQSWQNKIINKK